ncbi:hypothetical protein SeLEV6574_g04447 [Synchytrium endobioticum]|uniref:Uncharacterized protein n=1 Tax=Synchytrium endobioticum TaxID=286115 RepID=A0A507D045_9FUNG|nr:hypothetical protein SeLEV6574_g04447 [Synchytrium endobioticum]
MITLKHRIILPPETTAISLGVMEAEIEMTVAKYENILSITSKKALTKAIEFVPPELRSLGLAEICKEPSSEMPKELLEYLMEYNAYQYETVRSVYVKTTNFLWHYHAAADPTRGARPASSLEKRSKDLEELMDIYLTLEDRYADFLGVVSPHRSPIPGVDNSEYIWDSQIFLLNIHRYREQIRRAQSLLRFISDRQRAPKTSLAVLSSSQIMEMTKLPSGFTEHIPGVPKPGMPTTYLMLVEAYFSFLSELCHYQLNNEPLCDPVQVNQDDQYGLHMLGIYQRAITDRLPRIEAVECRTVCDLYRFLRRQRVRTSRVIKKIERTREVSTIGAMRRIVGEKALRSLWNYLPDKTPLSLTELCYGPTSDTSPQAWQASVEYNALIYEKIDSEFRGELQEKRERIEVMMNIYREREVELAKKSGMIAPHSDTTGVDAGPSSFDPIDIDDVNDDDTGGHEEHSGESSRAHDDSIIVRSGDQEVFDQGNEFIQTHHMPHHSCTLHGVGPSHASEAVSGSIASPADSFSRTSSVANTDRVEVSQQARGTINSSSIPPTQRPIRKHRRSNNRQSI